MSDESKRNFDMSNMRNSFAFFVLEGGPVATCNFVVGGGINLKDEEQHWPDTA